MLPASHVIRWLVSGLAMGLGAGAAWAGVLGGFSLGWWLLLPCAVSAVGGFLGFRNYRDGVAFMEHMAACQPQPVPLSEEAAERIGEALEAELRREGKWPPEGADD